MCLFFFFFFFFVLFQSTDALGEQSYVAGTVSGLKARLNSPLTIFKYSCPE